MEQQLESVPSNAQGLFNRSIDTAVPIQTDILVNLRPWAVPIQAIVVAMMINTIQLTEEKQWNQPHFTIQQLRPQLPLTYLLTEGTAATATSTTMSRIVSRGASGSHAGRSLTVSHFSTLASLGSLYLYAFISGQFHLRLAQHDSITFCLIYFICYNIAELWSIISYNLSHHFGIVWLKS